MDKRSIEEFLKDLSEEDIFFQLEFCLAGMYTMRRFPDAKESPIGLLQKYLYHKIKDECYLRNLSDEMHEVIKMSIEMLDKNFETIIDKFTDLGDFLESLE